MQRDTVLADLRIVRPLLEIPTTFLREFLRNRGQSWREDSSNASDQYQRNRVRHWLQDRPELRDAMIRLGRDSNALRHWLDCAAPVIGPTFAVSALSDLDPPLARHAGARWLIARGTPPTELNGRACDRLLEMATDAASPPAQQFPGGVLVRRRKGQIFAEPTPDNHGPILP
jgi:hypothetical protein